MLVGVPGHVQVKDSWRRITKQECVVWDAGMLTRLFERGRELAAVRLQMHMSKPLNGRIIYLSVLEKGTIQHISDDVTEME